MAKIWPVYEGKTPGIGPPWARLALQEAIDLLELRADDYISDLVPPPYFEDVDRDLRPAGFDHVMVEIEKHEGKEARWRPGFYKSKISPREAFGRLIRQALAEKLGQDNVVRVEYSSTTDSRGQDALKILVVIAPGAARRLANGAALDALVRLRERLREMRDDRTPIVEYATEADLEQDGGP
jgi:hypothetical protein